MKLQKLAPGGQASTGATTSSVTAQTRIKLQVGYDIQQLPNNFPKLVLDQQNSLCATAIGQRISQTEVIFNEHIAIVLTAS